MLIASILITAPVFFYIGFMLFGLLMRMLKRDSFVTPEFIEHTELHYLVLLGVGNGIKGYMFALESNLPGALISAGVVAMVVFFLKRKAKRKAAKATET